MKRTAFSVELTCSVIVMLFCVLAAYTITNGGGYLRTLKWKSAKISHYRYQLTINCFCPYTLTQMPLTIEVQNGNIVSIIDSNGEIITSEDAYYEDFSDYAPIDRLFPVVGAILKRNPDDVTVTYDTTYGFPTEIRVDYDKDFWDDELQLIVSGFHTLP